MTDVWWEWFCSLYPSYHSEEVDPYKWKCYCGHTWTFSRWQLLKMYLFNNITYTCPQCQKQGNYRMITHVVRDIDTKKIKEHNKGLE